MTDPCTGYRRVGGGKNRRTQAKKLAAMGQG